MDDATKTMIKNLEEKTGTSLEQWIRIARQSGKNKHGELVGHLKADHGLTHGYANLVAHKARASDAGSKDDADLVEAQYGGKKASLRPIYDRIVSEVKKFGDDVELAPKKAYVSLRRSKQFAIIQPSTATRVDVGINLRGADPTDRLEPSGSFNQMVSHRVRLSSVEDVDPELIAWLETAYDEA